MTTAEIMDAIDREIKEQGRTRLSVANAVGIAPSVLTYWLRGQRGASLTYVIPVLEELGLKLTVEKK